MKYTLIIYAAPKFRENEHKRNRFMRHRASVNVGQEASHMWTDTDLLPRWDSQISVKTSKTWRREYDR